LFLTKRASFIILFLISLTIVNSSVSVSDQKDNRLSLLFSELKLASSNAKAQRIEKKIWEIWMTHKDAKINSLMILAVQLMQNNKFGASITVFNSIINKAPNFSEAWNKRATVRFLMGNLSGSIGDINKVLLLEPRHFGAISGLGVIFRTIGEPEKALKAFKKIKELYPLSKSAAFHIKELRDQIPSLDL
jgi:tetratricopeptide (TPR) repeat protein